MLFNEYSLSERIVSFSFITGLVLGQITGIVLSLITEISLVTGIVNGIGAGVIVAMVPAHVLINESLEDSRMIVPFAMGWGTFVGILVGISVSWSNELPYMCGFSYGAMSGIAVGTGIGLVLWRLF